MGQGNGPIHTHTLSVVSRFLLVFFCQKSIALHCSEKKAKKNMRGRRFFFSLLLPSAMLKVIFPCARCGGLPFNFSSGTNPPNLSHRIFRFIFKKLFVFFLQRSCVCVSFHIFFFFLFVVSLGVILNRDLPLGPRHPAGRRRQRRSFGPREPFQQ